MTFPKPDRSDFVPNRRKTDENETLDIGYAEGVMSDGRPWRGEWWCAYQVTHFQVFFSTKNIQTASREQLQDLLAGEVIVQFQSDPRFGAGRLMQDSSGNDLWEVNVMLADEDTVFASTPHQMLPYPQRSTT